MTVPHIAIKSIGRAGDVPTADLIPSASIWVPQSQADDYIRHHGKPRVIAIPDDEDGNLCRKSNAILNRSPSRWTLIIDDDITRVGMFEDGQKYPMSTPQIMGMIQRGFELADQLQVHLWGINQNPDELAYNTFRPFNFLAPILGPWMGHLDPSVRFDESVRGKDDYDFWLQTIRQDHRTLRFNKYHYHHDHGRKPGGFVAQRTRAAEQDGIDRMLAKWGPSVFRVGGSPGARRDRITTPTGNILNSMVRVPIAGV